MKAEDIFKINYGELISENPEDWDSHTKLIKSGLLDYILKSMQQALQITEAESEDAYIRSGLASELATSHHTARGWRECIKWLNERNK